MSLEKKPEKGLTLRDLMESMASEFTPELRKMNPDGTEGEVVEGEEKEEAIDALKKALQDQGFQLLFKCGHCGEDWEPGIDEEIVGCEVAAAPGHMVCFACRERGAECPDKAAN